jgi:hypothetical protein
LLDLLEKHDWHMSHVAHLLRMGEGAAPIIREIHTLGLDAELEAARKAGKVLRQGSLT